jgi:hypothetical protein
MPICWFVRNRELVKLRRAGAQASELWKLCRDYDLNVHWHSAAVKLPGPTRRARPPDFSNKTPGRRQLAQDIVAKPGNARQLTGEYLASRRGRQTYRSNDPTPQRVDKPGENPPVPARYVGWTGKYNLGDEIMLESMRALMPWAEIRTEGEAGKLLLLGGGTLINRYTYLKWLMHRDAPSVERAVVGTGVASPLYWGLQEEPKGWVDWLRTCVYVGVRGPYSYDILRQWGFQGALEVCGDSALLTERPSDVVTAKGRVVVAPAWAKGELWGRSDEDVVNAFVAATSMWLDQGREVVFLASSPDDDGQVLQVIENVQRGMLPFVQGYADHDAALRLIASADVVVGERLHACVLAAAMGTPFVPIEYRPKLRDFAASLDMEDLVVRTDEISGPALDARVHQAMATDMTQTAERVESYRSTMRAAAARIERATIG